VKVFFDNLMESVGIAKRKGEVTLAREAGPETSGEQRCEPMNKKRIRGYDGARRGSARLALSSADF